MPNRWMDKEDVVYIYSAILLSHQKEWSKAMHSNMDGPIFILNEVSQTEKDKYSVCVC